jgi:3-oxoacyl-[acyl-carrier protein] reductase
VVVDIDEAGIAQTAARIRRTGGSASPRTADVSRADSVAGLFTDIEPLRIVFNCAGIVSGQPDFPDTTPERIAELIAVNVLGTILVTRAALLRMRAGVIVNVSSTAALLADHADPVYGASKAAVKAFTEQCSRRALAGGVRVNAVLPGAVDTPIIGKTGDGQRPAEWLLPRLGEVQLLAPGDIAAAMVELVEDDCRNGACVVISNEPTSVS